MINSLKIIKKFKNNFKKKCQNKNIQLKLKEINNKIYNNQIINPKIN